MGIICHDIKLINGLTVSDFYINVIECTIQLFKLGDKYIITYVVSYFSNASKHFPLFNQQTLSFETSFIEQVNQTHEVTIFDDNGDMVTTTETLPDITLFDQIYENVVSQLSISSYSNC